MVSFEQAKFLNVGSGPWYMDQPGWLNIDRYADDADIKCDARHMPSDWTDRFERAYCGHFLEHLAYDDVPIFLHELVRVCKNGAEVVVVGPALDLAIATGQPEWLLAQIRAHTHPDGVEGSGHEWNPTSSNTLKAMKTVLDRSEFIDIQSTMHPAWPNRADAPWQVSAHGFVKKTARISQK